MNKVNEYKYEIRDSVLLWDAAADLFFAGNENEGHMIESCKNVCLKRTCVLLREKDRRIQGAKVEKMQKICFPGDNGNIRKNGGE